MQMNSVPASRKSPQSQSHPHQPPSPPLLHPNHLNEPNTPRVGPSPATTSTNLALSSHQSHQSHQSHHITTALNMSTTYDSHAVLLPQLHVGGSGGLGATREHANPFHVVFIGIRILILVCTKSNSRVES